MTRRFRDLARGIPIAGFTGVNGAGKTLLAVESAISDMARGRTVYSTVAIKSKWGSSVPVTSLRHLLTIRNSTVLLDEVSVIFSSRSSQSLPAEIVALLQTLRHSGNTVRWTAPAWMRCDNLLREVTQGLVNVVPLARRVDKDDPWPRPRLVLAGLLDTSHGKVDATPTKVLRRRLAVPSRLAAWGTYDTHADTPLLGRHLQGGRCVDCGGTREIPKHTKARHDALDLPWIEQDELVSRVLFQRAQHRGSDHEPEHGEAGGDPGNSESDGAENATGESVHTPILVADRPRVETPEHGPLDTVTESRTAEGSTRPLQSRGMHPQHEPQ